VWRSGYFGSPGPTDDGRRDCLAGVSGRCEDCPYWDSPTCPVADDAEYGSFLQWQEEQKELAGTVRQARLDALRQTLADHGVPLHWEILATMVMQKNPGMFRSAESVLGFVRRNPEDFSSNGAIYRLVKG
jgi:hypothetical protein